MFKVTLDSNLKNELMFSIINQESRDIIFFEYDNKINQFNENDHLQYEQN